MKCRMFFAGSGGQGTLAIGQIIAKAAMEEGREVTWLPSYGPEMRGGTANCTVVVSDQPIRCPLIDEADVLVVMNLPSLLKFEPMVVPNGLLFINSDLVPQEPKRSDLRIHKIAVNTEAQKLGSDKAANIIMLGAILAETDLVKKETIEYELEQLFSGRKAKYLDMNRKALHLYF
ncbi:MAG: 2-oxoacid:acceptor oxidoreductase family protein [Oscillospiraceae bacterium]|nr:2-oxoacid:acceptor oxidoreductase family protein [Oscillospiraceae bacterium]